MDQGRSDARATQGPGHECPCEGILAKDNTHGDNRVTANVPNKTGWISACGNQLRNNRVTFREQNRNDSALAKREDRDFWCELSLARQQQGNNKRVHYFKSLRILQHKEGNNSVTENPFQKWAFFDLEVV